MTTPHLSGLCLPPPDEIDQLLRASRGVSERYLAQLPGAEAKLNATKDPEFSAHWEILKTHGRALPQEELVRNAGISCSPTTPRGRLSILIS
nr:hypothetical protein [Salipiger mucosus]